ncbi:MAG: AarF/ABC1/UbiB kinase family protein [Candidatus Delongbacteria bacterium]|jgi:ubiquinone biosynthesis protein|nr:AarF/ABC1/UbiB kinase family protein [Candidatus Delongbacteria bacterium]
MNVFNFLSLIRMIYHNKPDIDKIQKMGLLAVKIGQVHALRIDFLDENTCIELSKLYRSNTPVKSEDVLKNVDRSKFSHIDDSPLATASVGQVYRAKLLTGEEVVIKIIKSNFKKQFEKDVKAVKRLFKFAIFFYPKLARVFNPIGILEHIEDYTLRELDLRNEIEGQDILKEIYAKNNELFDLSKLAFPKIYKELSSENIMVSEYIPGQTFDEILDTEMKYEDLLLLFKLHGFFMFNIGTFHGDIHPGNLMLCCGKIYFVDTGAIGYASKRLSHGLLNFFDALSQYDYDVCAQRLNEMAEISIHGEKYEKFRIKFNDLYSDFKGKSVKEVSLTKKMMQTIKLGVNCGMSFEKGMFSIIKSLMFLDGMVLRCNPDAVLLEDMRMFINEFRKEI